MGKAITLAPVRFLGQLEADAFIAARGVSMRFTKKDDAPRPSRTKAGPGTIDPDDNPRSMLNGKGGYVPPLYLVCSDERDERKAAEMERIAMVKRRGRPLDAASEGAAWLDATADRLRHAEDAGLDVHAVDLLSPNGFATGVKYRKIDSPIDQALKRKWIDEREWAAGVKFMHHLYQAKLEPRLIANLVNPIDGSHTDHVGDWRATCIAHTSRAVAALPPKYRDPWMTWTFAALSQDVGVRHLGERFSHAKHAPSQIRMGKKVLAEILGLLARHYGL